MRTQATENNIAYGYPVSGTDIVHANPLPPWEHNLRQPPPSAPPLTTTATTTTGCASTTTRCNNSTQESKFDVCRPVCTVIILTSVMCVLLVSMAIDNHDPKFEIDSLKVSCFNLSDSRLTANWDVQISTKNINRAKSFTFTSFKVSVSHYAANLSIAVQVAGFDQPPKNQTFLITRLSAYMLNISDRASALMAVEKGLDGIDFDVRLEAKYYRSMFGGFLGSDMILISVLCKGVKVGFSPNATEGEMLAETITCSTAS